MRKREREKGIEEEREERDRERENIYMKRMLGRIFLLNSSKSMLKVDLDAE